MANSSSPLYLFMYPPTPYCYNISPFGIKLESFLRVNKIPHDVIYTNLTSAKGTIPYIRYGDPDIREEEISDSNVIMNFLKEACETTTDKALAPAQDAVAHAMMRMLEEHTSQIGFYYRYVLHIDAFYEALNVPNRVFAANKTEGGQLLANAWMSYAPSSMLEKMNKRGLSRHSDDELSTFSCRDIQALSDLLGDENMFFFGQNEATTLDCAVFGHLSQFVYIPLSFPQRTYMEDHCPNLLAFMERFRSTYWDDWETKCKRAPVTKYIEVTDERAKKLQNAAAEQVFRSTELLPLSSS